MKLEQDLRKQVYPFVNSNSSENYLGWLSFKSIGNVWLGKEMTSTGISFLWVTKYGDGDHGENTIITGYTRNNSNKQ